MTEPFASEADDTNTQGARPATTQGARPATPADAGVRGGDPDRLDSPGEGSGGVPAAGADGQTAAREDLRESLGERSGTAGREDGGDLEQAAALGETDDPQGGSLQQDGARP